MCNIPDVKINKMIKSSFSPNDKNSNMKRIKSYLKKDK